MQAARTNPFSFQLKKSTKLPECLVSKEIDSKRPDVFFNETNKDLITALYGPIG
jgi:hypothetical protein